MTAAKIPPAEFYDRVKPYGFNVLFVEPSWLVVLTEIARVRGTWPVKFFFVGGENMSEDTRRYIEAQWNTKVYIGYGQTETFGQVGAECPAQHGYHIDDLNLYTEIIDQGEDGYGELVCTTLSRTVMPLIRYRSTDITAYHQGAVHVRAARRAPHREDSRARRRDGQLRHGQSEPVVLRAAARRPAGHHARLAGRHLPFGQPRHD